MARGRVSQYGHGFTNGLLIRGLPVSQSHPGEVFYVNNSSVFPKGGVGGSDTNDGTYLRPFATLDYAIGKCTASRGDQIILMPGHAESVTAAAGITVDVAGIAIIGLGAGSLMPTITFTTAATADIDITAANVSFKNIRFVAGFADVAAAIDVAGTADGLTFSNCEFLEGTTDLNWVITIDLATGCDNFWLEDCYFESDDVAQTSFVNGVAHDRFTVKNCYFTSNAAQAVVTGLLAASGNVTNVLIVDSYFRSNVDGALWVDFNGAACGGLIARCYVSSIDTAGAVGTLDFTGGHAFECYVAGEAGTYGIVGGGSGPYVDA